MFVKNNIKKILYTLFFISLYKFGSYILLPGINENMIIDKSLGWWEKLYALNISNLVNFNIISV